MNAKKLTILSLVTAMTMSAALLAVGAESSGTEPKKPADPQANLPEKCDKEKQTCPCANGEDSVDDGCILIQLATGDTTPWTGSRQTMLKVFADNESPMVFTTESIHAVLGYTFKRIGNAVLSDGETPKEVVFSHPDGASIHFTFVNGDSTAKPSASPSKRSNERLMMVDAAGWATTKNPVYWDLYSDDGAVYRFMASNRTGERGRLLYVKDSRGLVTTPADMGVDFVYDANGLRQFLTPSRLADIVTHTDGFDIAVYPLGEVPEKISGLYAIPQVSPVSFLKLRRGRNNAEAVVTLRKGSGEARRYVYRYADNDWSLDHPDGVREVKALSSDVGNGAAWSKEVRDAEGGVLSRSVLYYGWENGSYALTNKTEGFGGVLRQTSWVNVTHGNGLGHIKTEFQQSGLRTDYDYDSASRIVRKTRSGSGMMTEVTENSYVSVDPSDVVPPVDARPRTVVRKLNDIECERTYYVYSPLTNIVERVGTQGAAYGGTNVVRTVTAFYPIVANDSRSGLVASIRHEDGKLDLYDYALISNLWAETVTHLHEQSPSPVSGKTTRDITITNARGETAETRTEAYIDGIWYTIARNRMTYNLDGKRVRSENLAGQVTTTAWDCCHKVSEVQPDGSTTTWDYDVEGRMIASSRLIPLDMTNVTWLTTCYRYDDLGRQVATWQTNYAAQVGLTVECTRYDQLGRVIARIDKLGNTTTTSYSNSGRVQSVTNANTSTVVYARNPNGDTLSITGTAVTPEFHSYGILPDGTRWSKTVQGETASSPRFTKRYENLLGQTIREERSGFQGAVLATTHTYDALGRRVSTFADYEPTVEYIYDATGARSASVRRADGQWRKTETSSGFTLDDGSIWLTQTNIVSCSDAAIAPLVSSSSHQLTGLASALPSRSRTYDIRGNMTDAETLVDASIVTSRQTLPYATNKPLSVSRYGISLMDVSVSAVTNTVAYDSLGRQIANTDGRGNTRHAEYNALGQRSVSIDAIGNRTTYAYDRFGNLSSETDPLGNATIYEYDLRGRKTYEGGATYPVRYTYDIFGNKTTMMTYRNESLGPDSGDVTTWLYDEASGCMTNKVYADGKGPVYAYNPKGKLSRRIWARGITTDYSYNAWGNLTNTVYSDGTPTVSLFYDALGRQIEAHDAAGITTFLYDFFGSLTNETVIGVAGTNTIIRYWDSFGRSLGYALNGVRQSTLAYDPSTGRLASMLANGSNTPFAWNYLDGSDLKSLLGYPNGLTASWQYDANGQLLQVKNTFDVAAAPSPSQTSVISQYDYAYDAVGRRVSCAKSGSAFAQNDTITYAYNNRSELTNAVAAVDSDYRYSYVFDDIGNRESSFERGTNSVYAVNQLNQYTAVDDFAPQFDDDGNQTLVKTATGIWSVTYNGENRPVLWALINSSTPSSSTPSLISMSYDRMGRRVTKNNQCFVYNGYLQIANFELETSNVKHQTFIWDPTESFATRPLVRSHGSVNPFNLSTLYFTHDGNKNISDVVTFDNSIFAHYSYSPFGTSVLRAGLLGLDNVFRFSSEYVDDELGLIYYNYRHCDHANGRWLARDPIGEVDSESLYSGFLNSAINRIDSLGLKTNDELKKECNDIRSRIWELDKVWFNLNKPKGCPMPSVVCGCCAPPNEKGLVASGNTVASGNGIPVSKITLCYNNGSNQSESDYKRTLRHELIHAIDHCRFKTQRFTCEEEMCSEIHAYSNSDCKTLTGEVKTECIKRGAKRSSSRYYKCSGVNVSEKIDQKIANGECL